VHLQQLLYGVNSANRFFINIYTKYVTGVVTTKASVYKEYDMSSSRPFEDDGSEVTITAAVPSKHHPDIIRMLLCQVAKVAASVSFEEIHQMDVKYVQILMLVKKGGVRQTSRLDESFELTLDEVIKVVDRFVEYPDLPEGSEEYGYKWELNDAAINAYVAIRNIALPVVTPYVRQLVLSVIDPPEVVRPVRRVGSPEAPRNETPPTAQWGESPYLAAVDEALVIPPVSPRTGSPFVVTRNDNSGSGGGADHSTRDLIVGTIAIAAIGFSIYHGVKYLAGSSLDAPVLSDLDTTL